MKIRGRKQKRELAATIDRGRSLLVSGQGQETLDFLRGAIQKFPEDAQIRLLYATILLGFCPDDVALQAARAVELDPNDPVILVRAATLMIGRKEVEAARAYVTRANDLAQPGFFLMPDLINLNGLLAAIDGEDDTAERCLRSAVKSQPTSIPFASELARFLASRHRKADALAVIDEAIEQVEDKEILIRLKARIAGGQ